MKHPEGRPRDEAEVHGRVGSSACRSRPTSAAAMRWPTGSPRRTIRSSRKSIANRVWSYFFGRGIIDPVDDIRASNPPSNPALLDALTKDFVDHDFDLQHLMRTIANSRAYQASIATNEWNANDRDNFSHAIPRRLTRGGIDGRAVARRPACGPYSPKRRRTRAPSS